MENNIIKTHRGKFEILYVTDFLTALVNLKHEICELIYGPQGGMLSLDENNCVVYDSWKNSKDLKRRNYIYFSVDNYLSNQWKCLKKIS